MRSGLVRNRLFLTRELGLEEAARGPRASKSAILAQPVAAWLERRGPTDSSSASPEVDRLSNQLARIERNSHVELESLALFIHYMLTVNAPIAEGDETARAIGRGRFAAFIERVGQQLASGRLTLVPEEES